MLRLQPCILRGGAESRHMQRHADSSGDVRHGTVERHEGTTGAADTKSRPAKPIFAKAL